MLGWYGIPDGMVFSFPVTMHPKGYWYVVQDLELTEEMKAAINITLQVCFQLYWYARVMYSVLCLSSG